jgi:hypothetical protein
MKRIVLKLIFKFLKIFKINKTTVDSKLLSIQSHLNQIKVITNELKNEQIFDSLIDLFERTTENQIADVDKMKEQNNMKSNLKHLKKP